MIKAIFTHKSARNRAERNKKEKNKGKDEAFGGGGDLSSHKNYVQDPDETEEE